MIYFSKKRSIKITDKFAQRLRLIGERVINRMHHLKNVLTMRPVTIKVEHQCQKDIVPV